MTLELVRSTLAWCTVLNFGLLLLWFLLFTLAHDFVERIHRRWFQLDTERFDAIHYGLMGCFKLAIFFFNLTPYLALRIVG